jgi:hypothetical protein
LGNTPRIALRHYLQVTDEDFKLAAGVSAGSGAKSGAQEAQNAAQQAHAQNCVVTQEKTQAFDRSEACLIFPDNLGDTLHTFR